MITPTLTRILSLMEQQHISCAEMTVYLGLSRGVFSNWKKGLGHTYYEHIDKFADRLGVSIDYLLRGYDVPGVSLSTSEKELLDIYSSLDPEGKELVRRLIRRI